MISKKKLLKDRKNLKIYNKIIDDLRKHKEPENSFNIEESTFEAIIFYAKTRAEKPIKAVSKQKEKKQPPYSKTVVEFEVKPYNKVAGRFAIFKKDNGELLDSAQGYGYKTIKAANKAGWYKFSKGWQSIKSKEAWWNYHPEFKKDVNDFFEWNWKEIGIGDITEEEIEDEIDKLAEKHGIKNFDQKLLKYL